MMFLLTKIESYSKPSVQLISCSIPKINFCGRTHKCPKFLMIDAKDSILCVPFYLVFWHEHFSVSSVLLLKIMLQ